MPYTALTSSPVNAAQLRAFLAALTREFIRRDFKSFTRLASGVRESIDDDDDRNFWQFVAQFLPPNYPFTNIPAGLNSDFYLDVELPGDGRFSSWVDWMVHNYQACDRCLVRFSGRLSPLPSVAPADYYEASEFSISLKWDRKDGIGVGWLPYDVNGTNPGRCQDFLTRCIELAGLSRQIKCSMMDGHFTITSDSLAILSSRPTWGITSFTACGAKSITEAQQWFLNTINGLNSRCVGVGLTIFLSNENYGKLYKGINQIAEWSEIDAHLAYLPEWDPLSDQLESPTPEPLTLPLAHWHGAGDTFYQCDVVLTGSVRRLQLITDVKSPKRVIERIRRCTAGIGIQLESCPIPVNMRKY